MGGTSGAIGVVRRWATVALIAVVSTAGVPVMVGASVVPLTTRVIALSLEGTPVTLENLRGELKVSD